MRTRCEEKGKEKGRGRIDRDVGERRGRMDGGSIIVVASAKPDPMTNTATSPNVRDRCVERELPDQLTFQLVCS